MAPPSHNVAHVPQLDAEHLSPELALVCPELAAAARSVAPEQPWEKGTSICRAAPSPKLAEATPPASAALPVTRRSAAPGLALVVAIAAVVATGAVRLSDQTGPEATGGYALVERPGSDAPKTAVPTAPAAKAPEPARDAPTTRPVLLASAGYTVSPRGSFLTDRSGRSIVSFTLPLRCGSRPLVIENVPFPGRSTRFTATVVDRRVTVHLVARALGRKRVRGTVEAEGPGCRGRVDFLARLS